MRSFDYDASIPLDAQIVDQGLMLGYAREKVVFTGCTGERIASTDLKPIFFCRFESHGSSGGFSS